MATGIVIVQLELIVIMRLSGSNSNMKVTVANLTD